MDKVIKQCKQAIDSGEPVMDYHFYFKVIDLLKEQEAKQGKWERQYSRPGVFANLFWWCSVCGQPTRYNDAGIFYQYCPHCGAKLEPCRDD